MSSIGLSQRLVAVLLLAVAPPVLLLAALKTPAEPLGGLGATTTLAVVFLLSVLWIVVVAVGSSWAFGHDVRSLIQLAERGRAQVGTDGTEEDISHLSAAHRRVAALLDERDGQVRELATQVAAAPITQDARTVAQHVAEAARRVTGDATWSLAVLHSPDATLPQGVYPFAQAAGPEPIEELHRWASVAGEGEQRRSRRIEGPWGAFVVADVGEALGLHAVLIAPWEGRMEPTPSELTLINLLAQHAETAIEHALLYAQVRAQADELNRLATLQTDFLRGVTHDLQTPLTAIGALAADIREEAGLPASAAESLKVISFQADRLRRMVGQLLTMSGLEAGAIKPRSDVFRAEPLVRRVWQALRADGRELDLTFTGPDRLMVGDPDRLEQALWALLDNAVKYSPGGRA
ncbi:MAG TPA: HAMP domain-containing sensor histidine kinase, partial [Methylomirabilota bacterium]|nr:HAMP domain-containing sensor histidine kinase [Methylomirabilota bacterium]